MDFDLLKNCSNDQLYKFVHQIIDQVCDGTKVQTNKYVPSIWSNQEQFEKACECCKQLVILASEMRSKHPILSNLSEETQRIVSQCLETRRAELRNAIVFNTIASNNPVLKDFDWKLNVVLASDKMININEPLLDLELKIKNDSANEPAKKEEVVTVEFNKEELNNLITSLETAQHELKEQL